MDLDPTAEPLPEIDFVPNQSSWQRKSGFLLRKYADKKVAASFVPPMPDPSLVPLFDKVDSSPASSKTFKAAKTSMEVLGAAGHATLQGISLMHSRVDEFIKDVLPDSLEDIPQDEHGFKIWRHSFKQDLRVLCDASTVSLQEAVRIVAAAFNSEVDRVRKLVMDLPAANTLKSFLKTHDPSLCHYFGNRSEDISAAVTSCQALQQLTTPASSHKSSFFRRPNNGPCKSSYFKGNSQNRYSTAQKSSFKSGRSSKKQGNAEGHPWRKGKGGQK